MNYLKVIKRVRNFLLIILPHSLLSKIWVYQKSSEMKTWLKLIIGHIDGKWVLTQIPRSKLKKYFIQQNISCLLCLDSSPNFKKHLENVLGKVNRGICIIPKLQPVLPMSALLTIYKLFLRPRLDYGDLIYDQVYNDSYHLK